MPFAEAVASAPGLRIVPWEDERATLLAEYLRSLDPAPRELSLFIGPEGGYSDGEIEAAKAAGAVLATLGRRVLRSETAAAVACGIVLHELDR
jgi:16S rRNA (uracil1498-N3)-methyltransferase